MVFSNSKNNKLVGFKQSWDKLAKIIFPKPKIVVYSDELIGRGALHAPEVPAGCPRSQDTELQAPVDTEIGRDGTTSGPTNHQIGRGAPCAPAGSEPTSICRGALPAPADTEIGSGTPCGPAGSESAEPPVDLGEGYTVLSKLGQGGSASVYKIRDNKLGKTFAAKVMRRELLPDNHAQLRFKQEAEAASCLTHPNLIAVYGSGISTDKAPYLVMDCLSGKTLAETLKEEGALDSARVVGILEQCCEALVHMHMKGIVHRDIKPSNIFLTKSENGTDMVKIVDFGIAKIQAYQDGTHLTQTGAVFGSPLYMSPEQCRGESLDFRSDIYSLGCVAYELLIGVSPFADSNPIKTIVKHISGSVTPPGDVATRYQVPEALQSIVMRCLEREPKARFQTADELRHQLDTFRTDGKLKTVKREIFPTLYKRLGASVLDGTIMAALVFVLTALYGISRHLSFHLHFEDFGHFGFELIATSLTAVSYGPAFATMGWWLLHAGIDNSSVAGFKIGCGLILSWFYFTGFESSIFNGTPGKKFFGISVVNSHGKKLSLLHANGRYFSRIFLLPLLNLENSIRAVRRMAEPSHMRFLRYGKELLTMVPNPPKPPTDDWTKSYVINTTALNNPYLPNVQEYLDDETKRLRDLNEINEKLKIVKGALQWNIGFSLLVILILITTTVASKKPPDPIVWSFWLAYITIWATPSMIYYRRFNRRKHQLLKDRNKKLTLS